MSADLRDAIFATLADRVFTARIRVCEGGVVCGLELAREKLRKLGCRVLHSLEDGAVASPGKDILVFQGAAKALAMAEDCVLGAIAKPSGIARAARRAVELAAGRVKVVSGAAKKMPEEIKAQVRRAIQLGGAAMRIAQEPFLYLDKNYVCMFGSVRKTLKGVSHLGGHVLAIQLRGKLEPLADETRDALELGARILMVDTGRVEDLELVSRLVRSMGRRGAVSIAFSGDIALGDIADLAGRDVDILDVGRAVIDAPMADLKMDVIPQRAVKPLPWSQPSHRPPSGSAGLECDLLEKTELRIDGITLEGTNLSELARMVAATLELPPEKVVVIDVRLGQVSLDILMRSLRAEQFFGRKTRLLTALAQVPGVRLTRDADIHSAGILGSIGLDEDQAASVIAASRAMGQAIAASRRARVRVYPTGFELIAGAIEDTNTPYLLKVFSEAGFVPEAGQAVADHLEDLAEALRQAAATCGVVVTTGGVGAEDKDCSVEAIEALDPEAATPYLTRFAKGHGRHVKDGVRLGVGVYRDCLLVALPGPTDEVRLAAPVLIQGLKKGLAKEALACLLARCLREKWRQEEHAGGPRRHDDEGMPRP